MTRRDCAFVFTKAALAGLLAGGALAGIFRLARREIDRAGRWMPREAEERVEDAMRELRFALRDPDQMRTLRAVYGLRELTGNECDWRLAVGRALSLAATDSVPTGCTELTPFPAASSTTVPVSRCIIT